MKTNDDIASGINNRMDVIDKFSRSDFWDWKKVSEQIAISDISCIRNKKIKTIGSYFFRLQGGGTERVVAHLARIWIDAGYRVVLFTDEAPDKIDYEVPKGVKRVVLPDARKIDKNNYMTRGKVLSQALIENDIDILIYHAWISHILLWDLLTCKYSGTRFVIHCHNMFPEMAIHDPVLFTNLPYAYAIADGVVTLSHTDATFWESFNSKVFETVNPMQYGTVDEIPKSSQNGRTVIWCQRFSPEKNPKDAIDVFKLVHDAVPDARFVVLGKGEIPEIAEDLKNYADEKGLTGVTDFCGYRKDVEKYYAKADVCLVTSDYEGFPMGLLESMGAGLPVVMYEMPYLTIVEKGRGIVSVPRHDVKAAASAVSDLLTDQDRRRDLGNEARSVVQEVLGFDFVGNWKAFFDKIEETEYAPHPVPLMWDMLFSNYKEGVIRLMNTTSISDDESESGNDIQQELAQAKMSINLTRQSASFKIGRVITYIPRLIRHLVTGYPM